MFHALFPVVQYNSNYLQSFVHTYVDKKFSLRQKMTTRMIEIMTGTPDAGYFFAFGKENHWTNGTENC